MKHMYYAKADKPRALQPFFEAMHRAVRPGGMVCTQVRKFVNFV